MSAFEPVHIFDSTDNSAVRKLSVINFHSCQNCAVTENNLYRFVIPRYHDPVLHYSPRAV